MSKIIDSLQKRFGTGSSGEPASAGPSAPAAERTPRQQIHEQLADVYFQGPRPSIEEAGRSFQPPTVVRVVDRSRSYFLPWLITLLALVLSTAALFSTKRVAIDIRVMDAASDVAPSPHATEPAAGPAKNPRVEAPEVITLSPTDFIFSGAALLRSSRERQQLVLTNSSVSGLAYAHISFNPALPALGKRLYFEVRGLKGGEKFEIVLKDSNGNTSLNWKPIVPFEDGVTTEWQPVVVDLEPTRFFNPNALQQLRIEFGSQRTGNAADATLLVRNLQWIPAESAAS